VKTKGRDTHTYIIRLKVRKIRGNGKILSKRHVKAFWKVSPVDFCSGFVFFRTLASLSAMIEMFELCGTEGKS